MILSLSGVLRRAAEEVAPEETPAPKGAPRLELQESRFYFSAPPKTSARSIDMTKANFQWVSMSLICKDRRDGSLYAYKVSLEPYQIVRGSGTSTKPFGVSKQDASIQRVDAKLVVDPKAEVLIKPKEVEQHFAVGRMIDLLPADEAALYVNVHEESRRSEKAGTEYTQREFRKDFGPDEAGNSFYRVIGDPTSKKLFNPLGQEVGGTK